MTDDDKRQFLAMLIEVGKIYDQAKMIVIEKSPIYWAALNHRTLDEVRAAINSHVRDSDRGRFFPKPADIEAQMPSSELWLSADEAWAMLPKSEAGSSAMNDEMMCALAVAGDLIESGDMVAARMAFKASYSRLVDEAKREGKIPRWFPSLGSDSHGRYKAKVKTVELQNKLLPHDKQIALPAPDEPMTVDALLLAAPKSDKKTAEEAIDKLKSIVGMGKK